METHPTLLQAVEAALDSIRPHLEADGGNVEVDHITPEGVLKIRWLGACQSCPMSFMTMKAGIEDAVKKAVPQITSIEALELNH